MEQHDDINPQLDQLVAILGGQATRPLAARYLEMAGVGGIDAAVSLYYDMGGVDLWNTTNPTGVATTHPVASTTPSWISGPGEFAQPHGMHENVDVQEEEEEEDLSEDYFPAVDLDRDEDDQRIRGSWSTTDTGADLLGIEGMRMPLHPSIEGSRLPIPSRRDVLAGTGEYDHFEAAAQSNQRRDPFAGTPSSSHGGSRNLADLFREPVEIMNGLPFDRAKQSARSNEKWILITIHDKQVFDCQCLNRDLWKDTVLVQPLIKENFIFCYYPIDMAEGVKHRTYYPFPEFPYIGIIDPLTGERLISWTGTAAKLSPADFATKITDFLCSHSIHDQTRTSSIAALEAQKHVKRIKSVNEMSEEEQLQLAISASITGSSTENLTSSLEQQSSPLVIEDSDDSNVQVAQEEEGVREASTLSDPFDAISSIASPEPETGDVTRIQFRLPDGTRKVRKFLKSDAVERLFEYIKSEGVCPESSDSTHTSHKFELMSMRTPLFARIKESISEANLAGSTVNVDFV